MKIIIAPQAFKGTFSAKEVGHAMRAGIKRAQSHSETVLIPIADGGNGTSDVLSTKLPEHTVFVEMAEVCGLKENQDLLHATTYGLGQVIRALLGKGYRSFIIGLGGSGTNDGGVGMLKALGVHFLDKKGKEPASFLDLEKIDSSGLDSRIEESTIIAACDVSNPLLGPHGATRTYGPQKGATPEMIELLEKGLERFVKVAGIRDQKYFGAAGGTAAALAHFLGAQVVSGAKLVLDTLLFDQALKGADILLIGEGRLDGQTVYGKAPWEAMERAKRLGIKVYAIVGSLGEGYEKVIGIEKLEAFDRRVGLAEIEDAAFRLFSDHS